MSAAQALAEPRVYKRANPNHTVFTPLTKNQIHQLAVEKHPYNEAARSRYEFRLKTALACFHQAVIQLGRAGSAPRKAFRMALTNEPWPRNYGTPRFTYGEFREYVRAFKQSGVLVEGPEHVIFPEWGYNTHPTLEEANELRIYGKPVEISKQIPQNLAPNRPQRCVLGKQSKDKEGWPGNQSVPDSEAFSAKMEAYDAELREQVAQDDFLLEQLENQQAANDDVLANYDGGTVNQSVIDKILAEPLPEHPGGVALRDEVNPEWPARENRSPVQPRPSLPDTWPPEYEGDAVDQNDFAARADAIVAWRKRKGW